jgi:hypothetical protein
MFWAEVNITDISLKTFLRSANITDHMRRKMVVNLE